MLLRDRLALITVTLGILTAPVAAAPQDKKTDPEPDGLVERVVDAYVKTETARAKGRGSPSTRSPTPSPGSATRRNVTGTNRSCPRTTRW